MLHQSFAPIHNSSLSFKLSTPMAGTLERNGFLLSMAGVKPADQNHALAESQRENLKSLFSSWVDLVLLVRKVEGILMLAALISWADGRDG